LLSVHGMWIGGGVGVARHLAGARGERRPHRVSHLRGLRARRDARRSNAFRKLGARLRCATATSPPRPRSPGDK
jgi:hypothetical protein